MAKKVKYDPIFCEMLIEHCKEGKPITTFGASIGCHRSTVHNWIEKYEDFKLANDIARQHLLNRGIEMMTSIANGTAPPKASYQATQFLCRAVYGLRDDIIQIEETENKVQEKKVKVAYDVNKLLNDFDIKDADIKHLDTQEGFDDQIEGQSEEAEQEVEGLERSEGTGSQEGQ